MPNKKHCEQVAAGHDETALLAEYFRADATNQGQTAKAEQLLEQEEDQRSWAHIWRLAAEKADA